MNHFPFNNYEMMVWCGKAIIRKTGKQYKTLSEVYLPNIVTHEFGHVVQAESECGDNWIIYYLSYFWNWFKHNPFAPSSYYLNKYECEAYANEHNMNYWLNYTRDNLNNKYNIKKARKVFREVCECSTMKWKTYIRSL